MPVGARSAIVRRSIIAAAMAATMAGGLSVACDSASAQKRLADGIDNPMPRYYDYRTPRIFYRDEGPVAYYFYGYRDPPFADYRVPGYPPAVYLPPVYAAPVYAPPVNAYAPPVFPTAPAVPDVVIAPRPICGVYRYWRDDRCMDARGY
jgi:hypothetical protein